MLVVGGMIALLDTPLPRRHRSATKPAEESRTTLLKPPEGVEFGAIVDPETAGIVWGKGIKEQGLGEGPAGWEKYIAGQNPNAKLLRPGSTAFDLFDWTTGEATSAKTLDTKTTVRILKPQKVYGKVKEYVDEVLDYERRLESDVKPDLIKSKTIQLAIPEQTSPEQWRQLLRAIIYGKDNNVKIVITITRE
jgi:filamentous hemagglutinin